ncbi:surfactant protein Bb isoform X2 [Chaetodon trifascialis]|uniref:surfactant protein Bb isoform X2 n=1 Tax=Chaetodon trifascialis TaxID=109706 RepID=UPI0039932636
MSASGFMLLILAVSLWPGDCRFILDPFKHSSLTVDMCSECSQIVQLSGNMISSRDTKVTVYESLHALCQRLPEQQASDCVSQVKAYLPKVLQQTSGRLDPGGACVVFGLCAAHKEEELLKLPHYATSENKPSSALGTATNTNELSTPTCTLCLFIIKKLETLLPTNMTEDALMKIMGEVCDLVPESYKEQCDDFVAKYGTQIVEFLLSSAAPHTICTLLHLCLFKERTAPVVILTPECESCRALLVLGLLHLSPNYTKHVTPSFLQDVCAHHPTAIHKCEDFIRAHGSQMQKILEDQMDDPYPCIRAGLCIASHQVRPLGKDPCIWGPSYFCRDILIAQMCGNQAFCKRYVWKE